MDRQLISMLAHADHPIAAPLTDESVRRLLDRAIRRGDERVLDLGCGGGAWLLRALAAHPGVTAEGVDVSERALATAGEAAAARGVRDRLVLHHHDAAEFSSTRPFDVVLSVGAAHAFGGLLPTLAAAETHLAPGGHVLVGDGYWEDTPSADAIEMLGDFADLPATVDRVVADGWTPVYGHVSTREELDDYEWSWTGSLASWALDRSREPHGAEALAAASTHRSEWLRDYRKAFGFVSLVLRRTSG
ncbi:SAM-dependent methyltransferase [Actinomadura sp. HBU206391]|uniref:SAM-dependent methyltransferase n=1 Tax=Actinomadura sp. HBU206391 TaxID=2731692 RepID=UPI001650256F|nr:class I SAM-dependent methyltransferase [Actinomadura sp. HBU206391]MBC6457016.1 class I SAM-dependent methyltransferase [Actinomadura sp. HBU206391]